MDADHRRGSVSARPPMLNYIAPVLRVANLERAVAFYRDRLEFEVVFVYESFYAEMAREGCRIHLNCATPAPRDQAAFEREEHIDICIVVADAEMLWTGFASKGVPFSVPLREMPYGSEFYVRDPDGYILGFVQPRPD